MTAADHKAAFSQSIKSARREVKPSQYPARLALRSAAVRPPGVSKIILSTRTKPARRRGQDIRSNKYHVRAMLMGLGWSVSRQFCSRRIRGTAGNRIAHPGTAEYQSDSGRGSNTSRNSTSLRSSRIACRRISSRFQRSS